MRHNTDDINAQHIFVRHLPRSWWPYAALMRLDRPIGTYLAFLPALMGLNLAISYDPNASFQDWAVLFGIFFIGAWLMRSAGCIWNDWLDRDLDKTVARTKNRPIASGQVTPKNALILLALTLLLSASLLFLLPLRVLWAALAIVPCVLLYPMMKRWTNAPQVWLGIIFNAGIWVAWLSVHGTNQLLQPLLLYFGCIFWTLGYDTVYALQDLKDDEKSQIGSMTRLLGRAKVFGITMFYFFCCACWSILLYFDHQHHEATNFHFFNITLFILAWLYISVMGYRWYRVYSSHQELNDIHGIFFRQNALFGLIISCTWIAIP